MIAEDLNDKANGWKKVSTFTNEKLKCEAVVHTRKIQGSKCNMSRADYKVKEVTLDAYKGFINDYEEISKSDAHIKNFKVIERDASGFISKCYFQMKMGSACSARDSCISMTRQERTDGKFVYISKSIDHPDYPVSKNMIRMDVFSALSAEQVEDGVDFIEFSYFNLKGWMPTRLLNMMAGAMMKE